MKPRSYEIRLPRSRSKFYPDVLRAAKTVPGFTEGDPNVITIESHEFHKYVRALAFIYETARAWKGFQVYMDDVPLDGYERNCLLGIFRCLQGRDREPNREHWCIMGHKSWGCRFLWGWCRSEGISRRMVLRAVIRQVRIRKVDLCPAWNWDRFREACNGDKLPPVHPRWWKTEPEQPSPQFPPLTSEQIWAAIHGESDSHDAGD